MKTYIRCLTNKSHLTVCLSACLSACLVGLIPDRCFPLRRFPVIHYFYFDTLICNIPIYTYINLVLIAKHEKIVNMDYLHGIIFQFVQTFVGQKTGLYINNRHYLQCMYFLLKYYFFK